MSFERLSGLIGMGNTLILVNLKNIISSIYCITINIKTTALDSDKRN